MPDPHIYNEKELLLRIAKGDQVAFKELLNKYNGMVYAFAENHVRQTVLIDEVVYDVFMQIWLTRETLPELKSFANYLFIIARNKSFNALKRELREKNRRQYWQEEEKNESDTEQRLFEEQALDLIDAAVAKLPAQQQKVWILSRKKALTYAQIAGELHISRETVKSYLQAANQSIKKQVVAQMDDFSGLAILLLFFLDNHHPLI